MDSIYIQTRLENILETSGKTEERSRTSDKLSTDYQHVNFLIRYMFEGRLNITMNNRLQAFP